MKGFFLFNVDLDNGEGGKESNIAITATYLNRCCPEGALSQNIQLHLLTEIQPWTTPPTIIPILVLLQVLSEDKEQHLTRNIKATTENVEIVWYTQHLNDFQFRDKQLQNILIQAPVYWT